MATDTLSLAVQCSPEPRSRIRLGEIPSRQEVRAAMRWWRDRNPQYPSAKVISHPWSGWVIWTTEREAGVQDYMAAVISDYRKYKALQD